MSKYKAYHTSIKTCYSLGIHKQVLPEQFLNDIPHSTTYYWKKQDPARYLGDELVGKIENSFEDVQTLLDQRAVKVRRAFVAFVRLYLTILNLIGEKQFKTTLKNNKELVVELIDNASIFFSNKEIVCKFLRISPESYRNWKRMKSYQCPKSLLKLCFKRVPQQISIKEIEVLKRYLSSKRYMHWSMAAIWAKAFRSNAITMSQSSWYRYAKALGITPTREIKKKRKQKQSIRAIAVNQIWHMDVSHFRTYDNCKFYIYTVVDNFSRKIVAHQVSKKLSAKIRLNSLKNAIDKEFKIDLNQPNPSLKLIVDGGSENNNTTIQDFIESCHVKIDKKIALKEVRFSNSMVEAPYRILKSRYFQDKQILSTTIHQELDFFIQDYNYKRPHYAHVLYTPNEIAKNPKLLDIKPRLQKVNKARLEFNKNYCCKETIN